MLLVMMFIGKGIIALMCNACSTPAIKRSYDLNHLSHSSTNVVVPARGRALVPTDLSIRVPDGTCGRIAPRSGLGNGDKRARLIVVVNRPLSFTLL